MASFGNITPLLKEQRNRDINTLNHQLVIITNEINRLTSIKQQILLKISKLQSENEE